MWYGGCNLDVLLEWEKIWRRNLFGWPYGMLSSHSHKDNSRRGTRDGLNSFEDRIRSRKLTGRNLIMGHIHLGVKDGPNLMVGWIRSLELSGANSLAGWIRWLKLNGSKFTLGLKILATICGPNFVSGWICWGELIGQNKWWTQIIDELSGSNLTVGLIIDGC